MAKTKNNKYIVTTSFVAWDGNRYVSYCIGQIIELNSKQAKQWSNLLASYEEVVEDVLH